MDLKISMPFAHKGSKQEEKDDNYYSHARRRSEVAPCQVQSKLDKVLGV
jgi:hypothetical protein